MFDQDSDYIFGIFDSSDSQVIGGTGLHLRRGPHAFEIGYWIAADAISQGYATEAIVALVGVGLEYCQRERIEIHCDPLNVRSAAIPSKLGFVHEATRRGTCEGLNDADRRDEMIWTLLHSEYNSWPHRSAAVTAFDAAGRQVI